MRARRMCDTLAARSLLCTVVAAMTLASCTRTGPVAWGTLRADELVTVQSGSAFDFVRADGVSCGVFRLVGRVAEVQGDTVSLRAITAVTPRDGSPAACAAPADGRFVVTMTGPTVVVTRRDKARTELLTLAAFTVFLVSVGWAIEHYTPRLPSL